MSKNINYNLNLVFSTRCEKRLLNFMIYILLFLYYIYQNLNELLMSCNKNNFLNTVIEGLFYFLTIL